MYPVDVLSEDANEQLTSASVKCLSSIDSDPAHGDWFYTSIQPEVAITANNIKQLQVFNDKPDFMVWTLHLPGEPQQVVALHLFGKWCHINDVLRSTNKSRNGLEMVKSTIERVLVLVLSQLVDRFLEEAQLFSNHCSNEICKLLWVHGEAVGFYSFKPKGSLSDNCLSQCYELPVLDTIYVRPDWRRRGFALLMLGDFCETFPNEELLGVSAPLSVGMVAVCKKFLIQRKEHRDVIYEVEAPGSWIQRRNIWLKIQLGRYSQCKDS
ncbi:unnamed protein product [Knipowitschia caucasica]